MQYIKKIEYNVANYVSDAFILQEDTTTDGQVRKVVKLEFIAKYLSSTK